MNIFHALIINIRVLSVNTYLTWHFKYVLFEREDYSPYPDQILIDRFHASYAPLCGELHIRSRNSFRNGRLFRSVWNLNEIAADVIESFRKGISLRQKTREEEGP